MDSALLYAIPHGTMRMCRRRGLHVARTTACQPHHWLSVLYVSTGVYVVYVAYGLT